MFRVPFEVDLVMKNVFFQRTMGKRNLKNPSNELKQKFPWAQGVPDNTLVMKCILDGRLINISNGITGKPSQHACTEEHYTSVELHWSSSKQNW